MFWISCCLLREGLRVEGPGSVETTAGEETAERDKSMLKTAGVKANRTLDAVSDGRFRCGHAHERSRGTADHHLSCTEQSGRKKSDNILFRLHILPPRLVTVSCASR